GGGPDEEEGLEAELHQAGLAAADDRERDRSLVDRLVEALRERPGEAVELIDEEDVTLLQRNEDLEERQEGRQRRPGDDLAPGAELPGSEVGQGGLPQPGRPDQERGSGHAAAELRRRDQAAQVRQSRFLADEVLEAEGAGGRRRPVFEDGR